MERLGTREGSSRSRSRSRSPEHPDRTLPNPIHQRRCDLCHGLRRCHSWAGGNADICPLCWEVCLLTSAVWRHGHRVGEEDARAIERLLCAARRQLLHAVDTSARDEGISGAAGSVQPQRLA